MAQEGPPAPDAPSTDALWKRQCDAISVWDEDVPGEEFSGLVGLYSGYKALDEQERTNPINEQDIMRRLLPLQERVFNTTGICVGFGINLVRIGYLQKWDCPPTGEAGFAIQGGFSIRDDPKKPHINVVNWRLAVQEFLKLIRVEFNQTSCTVGFRQSTVFHVRKMVKE
eukprot:TRINITY_DN13629_c0_g1_i1.p1 TRINITY_DN13629_c0_g1~~TRINITY_DN13629_c0_g1_i1.p1  ORF type:complete len:169 (+),score=22.74 TRINITY_DN13629_c0_g1_i1:68-574(+)